MGKERVIDCCRLASLLDVPLVQAAQNVVPVAVTAGDTIESLRQWASGRCLSAERAGVYSQAGRGSGGWCKRNEAGRENTEGSRTFWILLPSRWSHVGL